MSRYALYVPHSLGHEIQWLNQIRDFPQFKVENWTIYTTSSNLLTLQSELNLDLHSRIIIEEEEKVLFTRWKFDSKSEKTTGIILHADKMLHRLLFTSGRKKILIMRPYLESTSPQGVLRYLVKRFLIKAISLDRKVEIGRLSIPYSRIGKSSSGWLKDDFNIEAFHNYAEPSAEVVRFFEDILKSNKIRLGVLGFLDLRKNPQIVYETFSLLESVTHNQIQLILIGTQSSSWKSSTKNWRREEIFELERYLTMSDLKYAIENLDVVLLPYSNKGASGIAINSLCLGTPIVLCGTKNWNNLVKSFDGCIANIEMNSVKIAQAALEIASHQKVAVIEKLREENLTALSGFIFD